MPKKERDDTKVVSSALKILRKTCAPRCKDYSLGCFNCGIWRAIDDLQTYLDLSI